ncbi:MAG TPA: ABC transporter substrate-binding protein [Stellaceae bacterium]|nr:ABC transporter substrate-binding protein [Stellaceae bacterium]
MRRRDAIAMLGGALVASPVLCGSSRALAQKRPRITILHSGFPNRTPIEHLFAALGDLGYENARTATIDLLGGEGDSDRLNALVAEIAAQKPDVVIALTSPAVLALKRAGYASPVVFEFVSDPVGLGIVESLARPGGWFTGVAYSETSLGGKRLELLADALPGLRRVAVLWSPSFAENASILASIRTSATALRIDIYSRELGGIEDLESAFEDAARAGAQAVIFMTDNAMFGRRKEIAELAATHHLPSIHSFPQEVEDGGLISFGPDIDESYRRAAGLADSILKGAHPADLPVEEPTRFTLAINMRTAKRLGVTLPASIHVRADEVIE